MLLQRVPLTERMEVLKDRFEESALTSCPENDRCKNPVAE